MSSKRIIGAIDVDAGLIMIGDPCYVLPDGAYMRTPRITEWAAFCADISPHLEQAGVAEPAGPGTGVVLRLPQGDGTYPVYAKYDRNGNVTRYIIEVSEPHLG